MNPTDSPNENHQVSGEELNPAEPQKKPLELVREQQKIQAENLESSQTKPDVTPEVVGQGKPSDRIHHPQRQLYDGKD